MHERTQRAVIIGAGPAGLTAAFELLERTDVKPVVLEKDGIVGGIARTERYKGNRIDIGGHRFFSKSDRVMAWWLRMLPLQKTDASDVTVSYQRSSRDVAPASDAPNPEEADRVMLVRSRKSRILFGRRMFDYPLSLSVDTVRKLGLVRLARAGASYVRSALFPIRPEKNLEDFFINRFGRELYRTFFKSYTEKVWGAPCDQISAEWGAQRVKGLSIAKVIKDLVTRPFRGKGDVAQRKTETSLIERFLYPKFGPGQMWETVADEVTRRGGELHMRTGARRIETSGNRVVAVTATTADGTERRFEGDWFFSTMPVSELVHAVTGDVPDDVREIAAGLKYRDFLTVGLLVDRFALPDEPGDRSDDNWIYVQEPDVRVGRIQIFNNWSPYLVADPGKTWIGLEYFCAEGDDLWVMDDRALVAFASAELASLGLVRAGEVRDGTVIRMPKAYPAYLGTYPRFARLREWADSFENLFLIGRNGMHRYNNQDHSMLAAMAAVDNVSSGRKDKADVWSVNTEEDYHEEKK